MSVAVQEVAGIGEGEARRMLGLVGRTPCVIWTIQNVCRLGRSSVEHTLRLYFMSPTRRGNIDSSGTVSLT